MKRNLLLGLAALGAASVLCGFDSAETVDTLSEKINEASASAETMSASMTLNLDASINMNDGTTTSSLGISAGGAFDLAYAQEPYAMSMEGTMDISSLLGVNESMILKTYAVTGEDGTLKTYTYVEDSTTGEGVWQTDTSSGINMNDLMAKAAGNSVSFSDLADWGVVFELAPEAADVDGTECYLLSAVIDSTAFSTILEKAASYTGTDLMSNETVALALSMLDGIKLNIAYYIDPATYLPVKMHLDLNGSDLSLLNQIATSYLGGWSEDAAATDIEIVLNDCSVDMNTSYGEAVEVTVPDEALQAEADGTAVSVSDLADTVAAAAEE